MSAPLEIRLRRGRRLLHGLRPGARDRSAARTAWLELAGRRSRIPEVLAFARERVVGLRVVDSRH